MSKRPAFLVALLIYRPPERRELQLTFFNAVQSAFDLGAQMSQPSPNLAGICKVVWTISS
jgi:hypothetical protein